ncbi:MAG: type III secretion system chaperone [Puniceicoccales bacterium]|jgi:hypothetical protein|nr:type III secretion system chaperone [Puniceicoccales bacterium]
MGDLIKFKRVVGYLAEQLKLGNLEPDEEGACYLAFDDDLIMKCAAIEDSNQVEMVSYVGVLQRDSVDALREILKYNHFWSDTAGANLGLSDEDSTVMLSQYIDMDFIDEITFYKSVENFVNAMDHWKTKFPELAKFAEDGAPQQAVDQGVPVSGDYNPGFMMGV